MWAPEGGRAQITHQGACSASPGEAVDYLPYLVKANTGTRTEIPNISCVCFLLYACLHLHFQTGLLMERD